jgi:hypothetical protein
MEKHHVEIAAESYVAYLLSKYGYDVFVQYGPNQAGYDMVANKDKLSLKISVKGSQVGGWMLARRQKGETVKDAINNKFSKLAKNIIFFFVEFSSHSKLPIPPRVYAAKASDVKKHLLLQRKPYGHPALCENQKLHHPKGKFYDMIPKGWIVNQRRITELFE